MTIGTAMVARTKMRSTGDIGRSQSLKAFVAFSSQPGTEAKMFATALGGGILIDATIIRGLLAPALVAILGRWNWWLPARPARLLRVKASPIHPEPAAQTG